MPRRAKAKTSKSSRAKNVDSALEFNHAMVYVRELVPAMKFYVDHLGFKVVEIYEKAYSRLQSPKGGMTIALHVAAPDQPLSSEGVRLYLR